MIQSYAFNVLKQYYVVYIYIIGWHMICALYVYYGMVYDNCTMCNLMKRKPFCQFT